MIADLRVLVDRRELLADFAWRELRARYKGSALGFAWNFLNPLLQLLVYWILFGVVLGTRPRTETGEQPFAIFLFVGLLPWTFFSTSLILGAASIVGNGAIVKKVRLPVQLLPAASVLSALVNFLLSLVVLFAVLALFGPRHPEGLVYLPLVVLVELVLALGFAYLLAALDVFYRDVEHILAILLLAWYFLTPILFPISLVANRPRELLGLSLNPMTGIVVGFQRALLDGLPPDWALLAWSAAVALVLFAIGFTYFRRAKDDFESAL
ncbi:MAG TPA: ABC transporter permease [Candidatus Limnocylindria bacterium]|nr:ABC transporter permease [Candidatus Limnocylindria bacterium]